MTMYLNDCQRTAFYEGIGLNTKEFDMHVIIEVSLGIHIGSMYCVSLILSSSVYVKYDFAFSLFEKIISENNKQSQFLFHIVFMVTV